MWSMYLQVMERISIKSRIYLHKKKKSPAIFLFTVCWNWNATRIVLHSKMIQKRDIIGMILAGIYMLNYFRVNNQGIGVDSLFINSDLRSLCYITKKNYCIPILF